MENDSLRNLMLSLMKKLLPSGLNSSQIEKYFNYFMRILNSRVVEIVKTESNIVLLVKELITQSGKIDDLSKFQTLYNSLEKKKNIKRRWALIYVLYRLSNEEKTNNSQSSKIIQSIFQKQENDEKFNENNMKILEIAKNLEKNQNNSKVSVIVNKPNNAFSKLIYEQDLVKDLIFVFQAIDGHYITYSSNQNISQFCLNPKIGFNDNVVDIVSHLAELGFLYKKVKDQLNFFSESNFQSQIVESFCFAVQNELSEYYKLISIFKKMTMKSDDQNKNEPYQFENELTLKKLYLWSIEPKERMKWLAICCDVVSNLRGIPLISQIHTYVYQCGAEKYLTNILREVSKTLFKIVKNWLIKGELTDPYKEFFVEVKENVSDDDIWKSRYNLVIANIPSFFDKNTVLKIFEIGKCVNFIRNFCGEKDFTLVKIKSKIISPQINEEKNSMIIEIEPKIQLASNFETNQLIYSEESKKINLNQEKETKLRNLKSLEFIFNLEQDECNYDLINDLYSEIEIVHTAINKELLSIIFKKFNFKSHLESIYLYLLLGQGDMMQYLMNLMVSTLDKPSSIVKEQKHNLNSILKTSIDFSNAKFHQKDCLDRLQIKLLESNLGDTGWDIFSLEYVVDRPLNVIFNKELLLRYQEIFKFFWKLKKLEHTQSQIWGNFFRLAHSFKRDFDQIRKFVHKSMLLNQQIIHFCSNLHNYIALEVLETEWKNILEKLDKIESLDKLIELHDQFVENVLERSLINYPDIHKKLQKIFDLILRFNSTQNIIIYFDDLPSRTDNEYNYEDSERKAPSRDNIKKNAVMEINVIYNNYVEEINDLIQKIDLIGKGNLKFLSMKLNYNNFYSDYNEKRIHKSGRFPHDSFHDNNLVSERNNKDQNELENNFTQNFEEEEEKANNFSSYKKKYSLKNDDNENEFEEIPQNEDEIYQSNLLKGSLNFGINEDNPLFNDDLKRSTKKG